MARFQPADLIEAQLVEQMAAAQWWRIRRAWALEIAKDTPHTKTLAKELANMQRHVSDSGHTSYSPSKTTAHDDLVMATTLASWGSLKHRLPSDIHPSFRLLPLLPESLKSRW